MYLTGIKLNNFKRFESLNIDLSANINLLLGPNSSGKSSIIKSILGLKQTVSSTNEYEVFAAQGEYVDLGTYRDYIYKHNTKKDCTISIELIDFKSGLRNEVFFIKELMKDVHSKIRYEITYGYDSITGQARINKILIFHITKDNVEIIFDLSKKATRSGYRLSAKGIILNTIKEIFSEDASQEVAVFHVERFKFDILYTSKNIKSRNFVGTHFIFDTLMSILTRYLERDLFYLGPLRSSPSRSYTRTAHSLAVGPVGEHTPSVLANLEKRQFKATKGKSEIRNNYLTLKEWINLIFPGKTFKIETFDELVKVKIYDGEVDDDLISSSMDSISDVGFGFSQVFPILVQAAVMPPGTMLIVEQPELHLHPMAQANFAKVIVMAAKMGRRFIIETHSEHFLRGLQLAVSREKAGMENGIAKEKINVLYIPEMEGKVRCMPLDEWGDFESAWPSGFFDEAYKQSFEMMQNKARAFKESR